MGVRNAALRAASGVTRATGGDDDDGNECASPLPPLRRLLPMWSSRGGVLIGERRMYDARCGMSVLSSSVQDRGCVTVPLIATGWICWLLAATVAFAGPGMRMGDDA